VSTLKIRPIYRGAGEEVGRRGGQVRGGNGLLIIPIILRRIFPLTNIALIYQSSIILSLRLKNNFVSTVHYPLNPVTGPLISVSNLNSIESHEFKMIWSSGLSGLT